VGTESAIHILRQAGVNINKHDGRSGRSPLPVASANGLASTVAKLLDLGRAHVRSRGHS
jgi:hypothetical protein